MTDAAEADRDSEGGRMPHRIRTLLRVARRTRRTVGAAGKIHLPTVGHAGRDACAIGDERAVAFRSAGFQLQPMQPGMAALRSESQQIGRNHVAIFSSKPALLPSGNVNMDPCDCPSEVTAPEGLPLPQRGETLLHRFLVIEIRRQERLGLRKKESQLPPVLAGRSPGRASNSAWRKKNPCPGNISPVYNQKRRHGLKGSGE